LVAVIDDIELVLGLGTVLCGLLLEGLEPGLSGLGVEERLLILGLVHVRIGGRRDVHAVEVAGVLGRCRVRLGGSLRDVERRGFFIDLFWLVCRRDERGAFQIRFGFFRRLSLDLQFDDAVLAGIVEQLRRDFWIDIDDRRLRQLARLLHRASGVGGRARLFLHRHALARSTPRAGTTGYEDDAGIATTNT